MNGLHVREGDSIGVVGREIVVSEGERTRAAIKLGEHLLGGHGGAMLTIFFGRDVTEDEARSVNEALSESHPEAELYLIRGGQEIYPYLMVAE